MNFESTIAGLAPRIQDSRPDTGRLRNGTVVQRYAYSSFGKIESQSNPTFVQPYTFTSREWDGEVGVYYYRARYYDAALGRFFQEDPVAGSALRPPSQNRYAYVGNGPLNFVDPSGRLAVNLAFGIVGTGISIGYDVLQGRPVDWGQAVASGLTYSIVGGSPVLQAAASGLIGLGRALINQLGDCRPGVNIPDLAREFAGEALSSTFAPKIPRLPFDRLAREIKDPIDNAYLYERLHERLFDAQLKSVLYEVGTQGLQRAIDSAVELWRRSR